MKKNATTILECWRITPFRWKKNHFKCAFCENIFTCCTELREHVKICSTHHSVKDIYSKFKEMSLINVDVTNAVCRLCACPFYSVPQMRQHVIEHGLDFDSSHPDGVLPFSLDNNLWCCLICREKFNNFLKLYEHMNTHYQHYICATCGKGYMTAPRLRKHSEVHLKGSYPCDKCGRMFTMRAARDYHKANVHAKGPRYECPHCDMRFSGYYDRMNHLNQAHRAKEVAYECSHCEKTFKTSGQRSVHVRREHFPQQRNYNCDYCEWHFKTNYELKRHMVKHSGSSIADTRDKGRKLKEHVSARQMLRRRRANNELPEESERRIAKTMMQRNAIALLECSTAWAFRWFRCAYYCSYCDIKFLEPNDLRDHIRSNHLHQKPTKKLFAKLTENNMLKVEISDLKCRLCGLNFNTIDGFKEHLVLVHQKKLYPNYSDGVLPFKLSSNDFKCPKCHIRFASFSKMNEHMNSHFRNYICDTCGKGFVSKSRFRAHVQSHEVGSFPCGVCDEVLETRTARMCHRVKVHLKGVKYACPRCPEVFTKYNARLKHLVEKHGQQKIYYPCVHCGKLFETNCNRSAHYRMSHKVGKKCSDLNNSWNDKRADRPDTKPPTKLLWKQKRKFNDQRDNAAIILECSNACPFRWRRGCYTCAFCPKNFADFESIKEHSIEHPNKVDALKFARTFDYVKVEVTNLQCNICREAMPNLDNLKDHLVVVHEKPVIKDLDLGVTPFLLMNKELSCTHCGERFLQFTKLNTHMNQHYPNNICCHCGKAFSAAHRLKAHQVIHETDNNKCTRCDKVFETRVQFNRHVYLTHTSEFRYRCPYCNEVFKTYSERLKHLKNSHGGKAELKEEEITDYTAIASNDDIINRRVEGNARRAMFRKNIKNILTSCTAYPFKYRKGAYLCFFCKSSFLEPQLLREHSQRHHSDIAFKPRKYDPLKMDFSVTVCRLCGVNIKDYSELKIHLRIHGKSIDCTYGESILPYKLSKDEYCCQVCGKRYEMFLSLHKHMNDHYEHYICETCGKGFATIQRMLNHSRTHEKGSFPCKHCGELLQSYAGLYAHIAKVHKANKRYKCPICDEKFSSYKYRMKHLNTIHNEKTALFPCPSCPKVFDLCSRRTAHIRSQHLQERNHACTTCGMKFFSNYELQEHSIKHGGARIYQCDVCKKSYARLKTLREHMRIHNNDRRFVCPICGQSFIQKCSLKQHVRVHHPMQIKDGF
ncbi:unnamed protein product [Pieris macdunnoughi]|uniref:C2H2-type domain-containing protein n=1 Tax=Pieris macdunnoughi TaxID=345717 RepID=A0A821XDF4_9NEOP|nr:unnamed protein product [Pieris macdunnoughi]